MFEGSLADDFGLEEFNLKAWINKVLSEQSVADASKSLDPSIAVSSLPSSISPAGGAPDQLGFSDSLEVGIPSIVDDTESTIPPRSVDSSALSTSNQSTLGKAAVMSPLDLHASRIEHRLNLYSQELSARLDQLADDAVKSVPRLLHDISAIARDASSLATLVTVVRRGLDSATSPNLGANLSDSSITSPYSSISKPQLTTNDAFEALQQIDRVRTRMEMTRQRLKETENWSTLTSELDAIFASGDLDRAGKRLQEASRSLQLLEGTPEQEDRKTVLNKLKNRLEVELGPSLISAIQARDLEATRRCWTLFEQIGRPEEFESCYYRTKRSPFVKRWADSCERLAMKPPSDAFSAFTDMLGAYFEELLTGLHLEKEWCLQAFPNPRASMIQLIHQTFAAMKPSLQTKLESLVSLEPAFDNESGFGDNSPQSLSKSGRLSGKSSTNSRFLPTVIKSFVVTVEWCRDVERQILSSLPVVSTRPNASVRKRPSGALGTGHQDLGEESPPDASAGKMSSLPIVMSSIPVVEPTWGQPILDSFLSFQQSYGALESAHLARCLPIALKSLELLQAGLRSSASSADRSSPSFLNDAVRAMSDSVPRVFTHAESGLIRCLDLTFGFGFPVLIDALNSCMSDALDSFASAIFQIRDEMGLEEEGVSVGALSGSLTTTSPSMRGRQPSSSKFANEDNSQIEWTRFQIGLRILAVVRLLSFRIEVLENGIKKAMKKAQPIVVGAGANIVALSNLDDAKTTLEDAQLGASEVDLFVNESNPSLSYASSPTRQPEPSDNAGQEIWKKPSIAALASLQVSSLNNIRLHQLFAAIVNVDDSSLRPKVETTSHVQPSALKEVPTLTLLEPIMPNLKALTTSSQRLIFDSLFIPIERQIATIPHLREWLTADPNSASLPRFSLSPLSYVTRVGEHLLTLPQRMELHGGDDGVLGFSAKSLPYLEESDFLKLSLDSTARNPEREFAEADQDGADLEKDDEEDVMHLWITSISRATVASYVSAILRIHTSSHSATKPSPSGILFGPEAARQLHADVSYLAKVLEAMDVVTPPALSIVSAIMEVPVPSSLMSGGNADDEDQREGVRLAMRAAAANAVSTEERVKGASFDGLIEKLISLRA
ncbi:hypothetical protein HDU97_004058 [Phlyctochytrium planicorne]|nr:hypothetical protein HDU97_004058 [Phlyctochytrium planicorne]